MDTTDPEKRRTYMRGYMRAWRAANPDKARAAGLAAYHRHADARRARHLVWYHSPEQQERRRLRAEARTTQRQAASARELAADPINAIADIDLAYIAGLVDGEGCIGISRNGVRLDGLAVTVTMTHAGVLTWLAGVLRTQRVQGGHARSRPHHRPTFVVRLYGARAGLLCLRLRPYLRVKAAQADLAVAYSALLDKNHRLSDAERAERTAMMENMRLLNTRGVAHPT